MRKVVRKQHFGYRLGGTDISGCPLVSTLPQKSSNVDYMKFWQICMAPLMYVQLIIVQLVLKVFQEVPLKPDFVVVVAVAADSDGARTLELGGIISCRRREQSRGENFEIWNP